jgi:hypothetical protein
MKKYTTLDSPALKSQSENYPASWRGKVPSRICMENTVRSEIPFDRLCAIEGQEYDAYVNSHGALCAIFDDGEMLGLKPHEFTVVAWHEVQQRAQHTFGGEKMTELDYCEWHLDDDEANAWESSCDDVFYFENGDPHQNGMKFCPFCGKRLTLSLPSPTDE